MTEIPEHLLKRSQERRAALSGESSGTDAPASTPAAGGQEKAATPAVPAAATPAAAPAAPAAPPPPKPDAPYVAAYKARRKIPVWAMFTLSILPLWAFMYVRSLTPVTEHASGPIGEGATVFAGKCSSCHGGEGGGTGSGRQLDDGEVIATFPRIEDQINFVYWGTTEYQNAGIAQYGDPNRPGGAHTAGSFGVMPGWGPEAQGGTLTDAEVLAVVCHERFDLAGGLEATEDDPEYATWCSPESEIWLGVESGELHLVDIPEVGDAPRPPLADQTPPAAAAEG